jgi:hypothetical protein
LAPFTAHLRILGMLNEIIVHNLIAIYLLNIRTIESVAGWKYGLYKHKPSKLTRKD